MGTSTGSNSKSSLADLAEQLAAGAQKHMAAGSSLTVDGALISLTDIATKLTGFATLRGDVETARAALQAKVAVEAAQAIAMKAFIRAFVKIVRGMFGSQPDVLADFGLQPTKVRTPQTAAQAAAAVAKREATRAARGTKGPKAIQSIKGNVTGVTITPVVAGAPAEPEGAGGTGGTVNGGSSGTSAPAGKAPSATTTPNPTPQG
ncbi:MAG TPA: hypothetical protein VIY73_09305 [Polyangiaceae bacterium]